MIRSPSGLDTFQGQPVGSEFVPASVGNSEIVKRVRLFFANAKKGLPSILWQGICNVSSKPSHHTKVRTISFGKMPIEFLSFHALYQGWHSKRKCNCNSNSTCSNKITYFVKTCKLAFSQISDSNKASNKASTRINRVACCHKVSNFRCSSRGSSCHNPPCSLCSLGRHQCRRNK